MENLKEKARSLLEGSGFGQLKAYGGAINQEWKTELEEFLTEVTNYVEKPQPTTRRRTRKKPEERE